jgi:PTH1 family peptidyl-tRNA hydrolase
MKLIVGLGNPGRKYDQTRHNVGFVAASKLASLIGAGPSKVRFEGEFAEGASGGEKLAILWPHTYMNASGKSVRRACDFYKLVPDDLLVICDDLNLATGRLRMRASGSAGGQKGLADIIRHLQTDTFARLRIGIDRPPQGWEATDYVLGKFNKDEKDKIEASTTDAAHAAIDWATKGVGFVMNHYNADPSSKTTNDNKTTKSAAKPTDKPNPPQAKRPE